MQTCCHPPIHLAGLYCKPSPGARVDRVPCRPSPGNVPYPGHINSSPLRICTHSHRTAHTLQCPRTYPMTPYAHTTAVCVILYYVVGRTYTVYTPRLLGGHDLLYYTHFIILWVWNTSYCAHMFCTHNVLHHPHLRIFVTHEDTALYPYPTALSIGNAFNLHTWCYPVLQPLPCTPTRRCCACRACQRGLSSPCPRLSVLHSICLLWTIFGTLARVICVHMQSLQGNSPQIWCTDHLIIRGRENALSLLT